MSDHTPADRRATQAQEQDDALQAVWDAAWELSDPDPNGQQWRRSKALKDALDAYAAALRAPSPVKELETVIDRFIAEMETALPNLIQHYAHKLVRREMERAKGRTVRGLSAALEPK